MLPWSLGQQRGPTRRWSRRSLRSRGSALALGSTMRFCDSGSTFSRLSQEEIDMLRFAKSTKATVIPVLRYRDAPAAIEWLCQTFGFEKNLVVPNEDGTIAHAQLSFGNGMIMLGSVLKNETEFGRLMKQPDEIGGAETQSGIRRRQRCGRSLCPGQGRRSEDRHRDQGRRLRWSRLQLLRLGRPSLELRHL